MRGWGVSPLFGPRPDRHLLGCFNSFPQQGQTRWPPEPPPMQKKGLPSGRESWLGGRGRATRGPAQQGKSSPGLPHPHLLLTSYLLGAIKFRVSSGS